MEENKKTFTHINDSKICEIIGSAKNHLIYAAPSLAQDVAESIISFVQSFPNGKLKIVIDADAESFRLGFGKFEGVKLLEQNNIEIRKAKGLRIGILVADEKAWVYSPTPEIIFEQPDETISNGVSVSKDFAQQN